MEFDEIKKIWDSQGKEPIYGINGAALHKRIVSKKKQAYRTATTTELIWAFTNIAAGGFILGMSYFKQSANIFMYFLAAWMLISALYGIVIRIRRLRESRRFDRSMLGDLKHAISVATHQVRLSLFGRWNILPIGLFTVLGVWDGGKSAWLVVCFAIFLVIAHFATGWEHGIYKARKRELEKLQAKLEIE